jgi:superfamily I DNA/RNA helicase
MVCSCFERVLSSVAKCEPSLIGEFLVSAEDNLEDAVEELLQGMFPTYIDSADDKPKPRTLELMTMHGAKGLTRKYIVIPGCEDYWLPSRAASADPEEQKRLFYVAITRATDEVSITYPRNRARNDSLNYREKGCLELSRFARQLNISEERC